MEPNSLRPTSSGSEPRTVRQPLPVDVDHPGALAALRESAETWGARFEPQAGGGDLELPVVAGMRVGWLKGSVSFGETTAEDRQAAVAELVADRKNPMSVEEATTAVAENLGADSLVLTITQESWQVRRPALLMLLLAGAGGLFTLVWPFLAIGSPELINTLPLAVLLAIGGWFLVISQLRVSGPEDFLRMVAEIAAEVRDGSDGGEPAGAPVGGLAGD